jgi:uncharacterized protein YjiS (DUF1127 family)
MNARVSPEELALQLPSTMSHYFRDEEADMPRVSPARPGMIARLRSLLAWIAEMPKRQAVLDELRLLSDHELEDIGLSRFELGRVFDPRFAADRDAMRGAANHNARASWAA